jgi:2-haloacid dehalogenase
MPRKRRNPFRPKTASMVAMKTLPESTMTFSPKFITFDCHGTMIFYDMAGAVHDHYGDTLSPDALKVFIRNFAAYRLDEVLGAWKPYADVVHNSLERTCKRNGVPFDPKIATEIYERVPTWGPHADVTAGLSKIAGKIPLVALTNAMNNQIPQNIANLGVPVDHVFTAEDAQAYKPQMRAFEYMFDQLGCGPEDVLHVSSSFRYDLMTAHDLDITHKAWVNRGHEPANPYYGYTEISDISGLPALVGL